MSNQDPISDMLTRVRNAQLSGKAEVEMPTSQLKVAIAQVLKDEGFIQGFDVRGTAPHNKLVIDLKYYQGTRVIEKIQRVSRPGLRRYYPADEFPKFAGGTGVAIVSTSRGVMSAHRARKMGVGGELICFVV